MTASRSWRRKPAKVGVAEAAYGLAVEIEAAADGADGPALLHQAVDVLVTVTGPFDDLGAGQFRHRQFDRDQFWHGRLRLLLGVFAQAVALLVAGLLHRAGQVLQQMPPIGDLQGVRGGFRDRFRVGGGPVPADDLGTGMVLEPGREPLGGAVGKHIHDSAGLDVDGAVGAALAEGELVDPQHPRGAVWYRRRRQEPEQPGAAGCHPKTPAQPCGRMAAQFDRNRPQEACQSGAGAAVPLGQARHLLDERPAGTALPVTEVPANPQSDYDPAKSQRPLIQAALICAVCASRLPPTVRAPARASGGHRLHHNDIGGVADPLHSHIDPGKQHSLDRLACHAGTYSAETIPPSLC